MADDRAEYVLTRQADLEGDRVNWDSHWREIAERILPRQNDFQQKNRVGGEKRTERIFDSTACLALDRAASAIDSLITPQTQIYHKLEAEDEDAAKDRDVQMYLDEVNKLLFKIRYRPQANFASQAHECYISLMAFGTLGKFVDDVIGMGIRYKSLPMVQLFIAEDHAGVIDYVHRKFELTARAALQKWPTGLPEKIIMCAEKHPFQKFEFIHCVKPNQDMNPSARDYRGWPMSSYYVSIEGRRTISEGGYRTMPYLVSRHVTAPSEVYGRSPAMMVLPDIKMVNEMEKTILRAAHKIVDPPLLVYGDGVLSAFSTRPNAMNYGGVNEQGQQLVVPMKTGANLPIVIEMTEQKRKVINDAFYVTLFQILVQNPQMTATEALIRAQEKGQLLAPTVSRQQSEFLGPLIARELDILAMAGLLPPPPEGLIQTGGAVKVVYTSPLSRLRRAEDGVAISRTIETLKPIAELKPEVMDIFDEATTAYEIADINGVPAKCLRPVAEYQQRRAEERQAAMDAQQAKTAQAATGAVKNAGQGMAAMAGVAPPVAQPAPVPV